MGRFAVGVAVSRQLLDHPDWFPVKSRNSVIQIALITHTADAPYQRSLRRPTPLKISRNNTLTLHTRQEPLFNVRHSPKISYTTWKAWNLCKSSQVLVVEHCVNPPPKFFRLLCCSGMSVKYNFEMWCVTQETRVAYGGQEVGRRKDAEEVVVIWADSVALVWFVWFVSKSFVKDIIKWLEYQSNISQSLIIKRAW